MSPLEEIEEAIERLEAIKARPTLEISIRVDNTEGRAFVEQAQEDLGMHERLVDPLLDMLRTARNFYGAGITGPETATVFAELALSLARAINGGAS